MDETGRPNDRTVNPRPRSTGFVGETPQSREAPLKSKLMPGIRRDNRGNMECRMGETLKIASGRAGTDDARARVSTRRWRWGVTVCKHLRRELAPSLNLPISPAARAARSGREEM